MAIRLLPLGAVILFASLSGPVLAQQSFIRGDGNGDQSINIADAIYGLQYLFAAGPADCLDALDADDSGSLDIADPIFTLDVVFVGTTAFPPPGPLCGPDPTPDSLDCAGPVNCLPPQPTRPIFPLTISEPGAVALDAGDIDLDGSIDLVAIRTGQLQLRIADGEGGFAPPLVVANGVTDPVRLRDLEGDGDLDIVAMSSGSDEVVVLLNDGLGGYGVPMSFSTAGTPESIAIEDLDGDGLLDLAVGCTGAPAIDLLIGTAMGGFVSNQQLALSGDPTDLQIADLNSDGLVDVAVAIEASSMIELFLDDTMGGWTSLGPIAAGGAITSLLAADFDGDSVIDLLGGNRGDSTLSFLRGNNDGTFVPPMTQAAGGQPRTLALGEFDNDPLPEVAITTSTNLVRLFHGDAVNGIVLEESTPTPAAPNALALADLDQDGNLDAVVGTGGVAALVALYGCGDGTFLTRSSLAAISNANELLTTDVNGDGFADVLAVGLSNTAVFLGAGDGSFTMSQMLSPATSFQHSRVGDLNGDGLGDLVFATGVGIGVYLGSSTGTLGPPTLTNLGLPVSFQIALGDVNNDGNLDALTIGLSGPISPLPTNVFLGDGTGSLTLSGNGGLALNDDDRAITLADLDADGNLDLVVGSWAGSGVLRTFAGLGTGNFDPAPATQVLGSSPITVQAADFDDDGNLDVVTTSLFGTPRLTFGNGDLTFTGAISLFSSNVLRIALGDLNLDGALDLLVPDVQSDRVFLLANDGAGGFSDMVEFVVDGGPGAVSVGDFDGDGDLDCSTLHAVQNRVNFLEATLAP